MYAHLRRRTLPDLAARRIWRIIWETVRERYRVKYSDRAKMGTLSFSDTEVTMLSPDAAVVLGRWRLKRANDEPHGRFTLIFKRLPEGWRIVHDHTSAAKE